MAGDSIPRASSRSGSEGEPPQPRVVPGVTAESPHLTSIATCVPVSLPFLEGHGSLDLASSPTQWALT